MDTWIEVATKGKGKFYWENEIDKENEVVWIQCFINRFGVVVQDPNNRIKILKHKLL